MFEHRYPFAGMPLNKSYKKIFGKHLLGFIFTSSETNEIECDVDHARKISASFS